MSEEKDQESGDKSAGDKAESTDKEIPEGGKDPVRKITLIVLSACLVIFIWYVAADRYTPYTDLARIQSVTVPIVPQVAGYITEINVRLHSTVPEGTVLFEIDKRQYDLAVRSAEANLDQTVQSLGAKGASVKAAAARVGVARAQLDRAQRSFNRTQLILDNNPGALSQADRDRAETGLAQAVERLSSSEADLEKAQEQLGVEGPENPELRAAITALEQAQLNLEFATLYAPSNGVVESFRVDLGHYAQAGQPLATFISDHDIWIEADMRENNISNVKPGDNVEFSLDIAPGRVFKGSVRSIGYGVSSGSKTTPGDLPTITSAQGWLRDPQRFPVIIGLNEGEADGLRRVGGQADVVVYTRSSNFLLDTIAWIQIRLRSWISYVR
jgi:multidrug resistance efflux pump